MRVVVFGNSEFASLAWYALTHDSPYEVIGFTVDRAFLRETTLHDLPVVAFEEAEKHFPPATTEMLAPLGGRQMNGLRAEKHRAGKAKGFRFISYVSTNARLWPDLSLGENCMIFENAVIEPFARLGDGVIVRSGCNISHHVQIADNCFLAPRVCVGGRADIGERCFLGLNSTILPKVALARCSFIAAGAVITGNTEENATYQGVPATRSSAPADRVMEHLLAAAC